MNHRPSKIVCVGRNYADHAKELGNEVPKAPLLFLKAPADMVFAIPLLLSYISEIMTLEPGDLVATGTPAGVGLLVPGEVVEVDVPGIGILGNPVKGYDQ